MNSLRQLAHRINSNPISRNLVLAVCAILVLVFVANVLLNLFTRHGQVHVVPDLSGMDIDEATHAGRESSLKIEVGDSLYLPSFPGGVILEQTPSAGAKVKSGRRIFVTINSFQQKMVKIPYVAGFSLRQAKNNLEVAGLQIEKLIYQPDLATNNVLEERYGSHTVNAGSNMQAEMGSGITLIVGMGDGATAPVIPRVVGYTLREAKSRLWEVGFNVGSVSREKGVSALNEHEAKVCVQRPVYGIHASLGTPVNLTLTIDEEQLTKGRKEAERTSRAAVAASKTSEVEE